MTRRIIKMLDDEAKNDADKFNKWFSEFQMFLKDGIFSDPDNKEALFRLMRFNSKTSGPKDMISID